MHKVCTQVHNDVGMHDLRCTALILHGLFPSLYPVYDAMLLYDSVHLLERKPPVSRNRHASDSGQKRSTAWSDSPKEVYRWIKHEYQLPLMMCAGWICPQICGWWVNRWWHGGADGGVHVSVAAPHPSNEPV